MIDRKCRFKALVHQVGVEHRDLLSQHHAFVDDAAARQAAQVNPLDLCGEGSFLDPAADDVEIALKLFLIDVLVTADQDLFDLGARGIGLFAQHGRIDRHMTPAVNIVAHAQNFGFHDGPAAFLRRKIGARQEHLTHGDQLVHVRLMPGAAHLVIKERHRDLHMDARAIAGLAVGIDSAAVPDRLERVDTVFDDLARRLARNGNHQANPARGVLVVGFIKPVGVHEGALCLFGGDPCFIIFGHCAVSSP